MRQRDGAGETKLTFDGSNFHHVTTYADGKTLDEVAGVDHGYRPGTLGSYAGYLCND